ncbi:MAG: RDD family protein [Pseudomonadota bacterium]
MTQPIQQPSPASINPYAATAQDLDIAHPDEQQLAGRGTRLAAKLLDSVPPLLIAIATAVLIQILGTDNQATMIIAGVLGGLGILAFMGYQLVLISRHGQTFGKRKKNIRVLRVQSGEICGLGRYFWLRAAVPTMMSIIPLVGPIFSLVDILMIFGTDRRCLHDLIADTKVVKV